MFSKKMGLSELKFWNTRIAILLIVMVGLLLELRAQPNWTAADYNKALWMTTRFYGGQRSGDNNWLLYNHLPAGVHASLTGRAFRADAHSDGNSLIGGWHDCGDHVKFGQTQFYSAYMLLKGYAEFPTGYDDFYGPDYQGYKTSGQWNWEGTGHAPNCIPDILDEMKHETDFLIKCIPNATNFYYQVGNGGGSADHAYWETAVKSQTRAANTGNNDLGVSAGPTLRPACKNPADASMVSFCGATLALMARVYQPYDAAYAALCLTHAQYCYTYAKAHPGRAATCFGGFYGANDNWEDDFTTMCAELFWTTGTAAYNTEAQSYEPTVVFNAGWTFDYSNNGEIALYNLAKLGNASALTRFNNRITGHYMAAGSRTAAGVYNAYGGGWGALRYNGNAAFLIALYSKLNNNTTAAVINAIHNDIDYIMGKNVNKRSYIVGFEPAAGGPFLTPLKPHHRNVYLRDDNPGNADNSLTIPAKNAQMGALVGGKRDGTYTDDRNDYVNSEVCIDYNACLVGALGFIKSRLAPVTGACQTCATPKIGADLSTCSGSIFPLTLTDASTPGAIPSGVTFTWRRLLPTPVTTPIGTAGATAKTRVIAAADCPSFPCQIEVVRDSTGGCSRRDTITITNSIAVPILAGGNLCNPAFMNLTPSNLASYPGGVTWQWAVDYSGGTTYNNLTGETASTLSNVRTAGRYRLTASLGSCNNNANAVITSSLPTPVDGCVAAAGNVTLSVTNPGLNGTNYNWYTTPSGSTLVTTVPANTATNTTSITTNIAATTTFYVQDMSAVNTNVGPTTQQGAGTNWGVNAGNHLLFTANSNFTLNSFQVPFGNIYSNNAAATITIEILTGAGASFGPARTFTSNPTNVTTAMANGFVTFSFTGLNIQSAWGPTLRMRVNATDVNGEMLWSAGPGAYPYNSAGSIVSITGAAGGSGDGNDYMYFYNWNISTGTPCSRIPVVAKVGGCLSAPISLVSFTAKKEFGKTVLYWVTASELNNDYFQVERSLDGIVFSPIGTVNGFGTRNEATSYVFVDEESFNQTVYYRLTQVDFDGTSTVSGIAAVENQVAPLEVVVAPNPFTNSTEVYIGSSEDGKAIVTLSELTGHVVQEGTFQTNQSISVGQNLTPGVYILQVALKGQVKVIRVVKQ